MINRTIDTVVTYHWRRILRSELSSQTPDFIAPYPTNTTVNHMSTVVFQCHIRSNEQPQVQVCRIFKHTLVYVLVKHFFIWQETYLLTLILFSVLCTTYFISSSFESGSIPSLYFFTYKSQNAVLLLILFLTGTKSQVVKNSRNAENSWNDH